MSETIEKMWLTNPATENKIAPKTTYEQVINTQGKNLGSDISEIKESVSTVSNNLTHLTWKQIGTSTGDYNFSQYYEVMIQVTNGQFGALFNIPVIALDSGKYYRNGAGVSASDDITSQIYIGLTKLQNVTLTLNGSTVTPTIKVYAR